MDMKEGLDHWEEGWKTDKMTFVEEEVICTLQKYYDKLTKGAKGLKILVPLCGKSVDMKWLADMGHDVIGIEGVSFVVQQFFDEKNINYSVTDILGIPDGQLFTSESRATAGTIKIYKCDIFAITKEMIGMVDVVWDHLAFVALAYEERLPYANLMHTLMKPGALYLIDVLEYDWEERTLKQSPRPAFPKDMVNVFGNWSDVKELDRDDIIDSAPHYRSLWGLQWMTNVTYLISKN